MTSEESEIRYIHFRYPDFPIYHPFYPTPLLVGNQHFKIQTNQILNTIYRTGGSIKLDRFYHDLLCLKWSVQLSGIFKLDNHLKTESVFKWSWLFPLSLTVLYMKSHNICIKWCSLVKINSPSFQMVKNKMTDHFKTGHKYVRSFELRIPLKAGHINVQFSNGRQLVFTILFPVRFGMIC
jgi:hypothetical protein